MNIAVMFWLGGGSLFAVVVIALSLVRCPAGRALVLAGRRAGHRVVAEGRAVRWPFVETLASLDLAPIRVAFGGRAGVVAGEARVCVARDARGLDAAASYLLGLRPQDVAALVRPLFECCAQRLPPEHAAREAQLSERCRPGLARLGLALEGVTLG